MKRILAVVLAIVMGGLCAAAVPVSAVSTGTIRTVVRYEPKADGVAVGGDTLNLPGQGNGRMRVFLTGEDGLTKAQAESVTAEATNGASAEVSAVEIGTGVYAAAIVIDASGAGLRSSFAVTITGAGGEIHHTLDCTYGMIDERVYYEDIDEETGYREVSNDTTEVEAFFRGVDGRGLDDENWTVVPHSMSENVSYTAQVMDYKDGKKQICVRVINNETEDISSWNTFAFVDPDGVLQASFMLVFWPAEELEGNEPGGDDPDSEMSGGGVLFAGAEDNGFTNECVVPVSDPKVTVYWRGPEGEQGGFESEEELSKATVEQFAANDELTSVITKSVVKIPGSDLYQLKIDIEISGAAHQNWVLFNIRWDGRSVEYFWVNTEAMPTIAAGGTPLAGKSQTIYLDGTNPGKYYWFAFGVEEIYLYYRGADNAGLTETEAEKYSAEILESDGLSPWGELSYEVVKMADAEDLYQLKLTMKPSNVTWYSEYVLSINCEDEAVYGFKLLADGSHFDVTQEVEINGKNVRFSVAQLQGTTKVEETGLSTWILEEDQRNDYYGEYHNVIGAFSGEEGSLEHVATEETWVYALIKEIEVEQIANDPNNVMFLGKVYNDDPAQRGFDIYRCLQSGFIEVKITIHFVDSLNMSPVVLTTRFSSHEQENVRTTEIRPMDDTVEKLNQFLAEFDYSSLKDDLYVELAPITYEGTIVIPEGAYTTDDGTENGNWYHVFLNGNYGDGRRTTVVGTLEVRGFSGHHYCIDFVAPEKTDANEKTIAVNAIEGFDGGLALQDCSFTGYDIAVNCDGAYILPTDRNVFTDNGIALYIDAAGRALRHDYMHLVYNNSFLNNETAIYIKSLPDTIDPYDFRISKNDFINNKNDIISEEKSGYQYFFDNYHGVYNGSDEGHTHRAAQYNHDNKYLQVYPTFEESVANLNDTDALPARKVTGQVKNMALPLEGSTRSMSIDTASLQEDRTEDLIIEMMNDEDEMQAAWTIPAQQTATFANMRLMRMSASSEGFVPYVEVTQGLNTAVIDVTDCEALAQLHPTLSVQLENCSEDVNAVKVTIDGSEIPAQWDAQTCTAAFEPVSGGRYVITAYVDTEQEPDDGDDNTDDDEVPVVPIVSVSFDALPEKIVYAKGEALDLTGLSVTNNGVDASADVEVTGFDANTVGQQTVTLTLGSESKTYDVYVFGFSDVSLTLEGMIRMNFYAQFPGAGELYTGGVLLFTEEPDQAAIKAALAGGKLLSGENADNGAKKFVYEDIDAKEMNDRIYAVPVARLAGGEEIVGAVSSISVAEYVTLAFDTYQDAQLRTMLVDMLNYGAAAQQQFGYRTDALATSGLTEAQLAYSTQSKRSMKSHTAVYTDAALTGTDITMQGASLVLRNELTINIYAALNGAAPQTVEMLVFDSYSAGGTYDETTAAAIVPMTAKNGAYVGGIGNIPAKNMRTRYYARVHVVYPDGTESYSAVLCYNVETYAYTVSSGVYANTLKTLVDRMMRYGDSAAAYFK